MTTPTHPLSPQSHLRAWLDAHPTAHPTLGVSPLGAARSDPRPDQGSIAAGFLSYLLPLADADGPWLRVDRAHRALAHNGAAARFARTASPQMAALRFLAIEGVHSTGHVWWFEDNSGLLLHRCADGSALVHPAVLRMVAPPATCSVRFSAPGLPPALHLRSVQPNTPRKADTTLAQELVGTTRPDAHPWALLLRATVDALDGVFAAPTLPLLPPHLAPHDRPALWARCGPRLLAEDAAEGVAAHLVEVANWLGSVVHRHGAHRVEALHLARAAGYKTNAATLTWTGAQKGAQTLPMPQWRTVLPPALADTLARALHTDLGLTYAPGTAPGQQRRWMGHDAIGVGVDAASPSAHTCLAAAARHGVASPEQLARMERLIPRLLA